MSAFDKAVLSDIYQTIWARATRSGMDIRERIVEMTTVSTA